MNQTNIVDVKAWIDARPISRFQWHVLLLCFLIIMLDGYDAAVMGFIAPALIEDWGIKVVKTLRDAAGESVMSQATAIAQRHLPERMAALGITYAQLEPFNWKALTALLKEHI